MIFAVKRKSNIKRLYLNKFTKKIKAAKKNNRNI